MATVFEWARRYVEAGLSVIPVRSDGSKAPVFPDWRQYTDRLPTGEELAAWFDNDRGFGLGVVPGPASGNLAVMDFEVRDGVSAFDVWKAGLSAEQTKVVAQCPLIGTPSGGRHLWVRGTNPRKGSILARTETGLIFIEIRGTGQQVLVPGCPLTCHKSGNPYTFEHNGWLPKWN